MKKGMSQVRSNSVHTIGRYRFQDNDRDGRFSQNDVVICRRRGRSCRIPAERFMSIVKGEAGRRGALLARRLSGMTYASMSRGAERLLPSVERVAKLVSMPRSLEDALDQCRVRTHQGMVEVLYQGKARAVPGIFAFRSHDYGVRALLTRRGYAFVPHPRRAGEMIAYRKG